MNVILKAQTEINDKLSQRFIELDPSGYFLIYLDREANQICVEHFTNAINDRGLAVDPETGKPLNCRGSLKRKPTAVFKAKTAKELCIQLFEDSAPPLLSKLDHAAYLGRELMRAELALAHGEDYVQD